MKLFKEQVWIHIESEADFQKAKEILEKNGEIIIENPEVFFSYEPERLDHILKIDRFGHWWIGFSNHDLFQVSLQELQTILKNS